MFKFAIGLAFVLTIAPAAASAQCTKDTDCKGERICREGNCVEPEVAAKPAPLPTAAVGGDAVAAHAPSPQATTEASTGWALAASIIGFVGSAPILGLSIGSAVAIAETNDSYDSYDCEVMGECDDAEDKEAVAWSLGIPAIIAIAALGPVVYLGGRSARRHPAVDGSLGLRITGIVTYGVSLSCALGIVAVGIAGERVPPALPAIVGGTGAVSIVALSIEALISRKEAKAQSKRAAEQKVTAIPIVSPLIAADGVSGGLVGLGGRF